MAIGFGVTPPPALSDSLWAYRPAVAGPLGGMQTQTLVQPPLAGTGTQQLTPAPDELLRDLPVTRSAAATTPLQPRPKSPGVRERIARGIGAFTGGPAGSILQSLIANQTAPSPTAGASLAGAFAPAFPQMPAPVFPGM